MKARWSIPALVTAMLILFVIGLFSGPARLEWSQEWAALRGDGGVTAETIMWKLRLPRLVSAALSGAALGLSGLLMQTFFRNPLAGPGVLGVSSGATLGVALVALGRGRYGEREQHIGHRAASGGCVDRWWRRYGPAGAGHGAVSVEDGIAHFWIDGGVSGWGIGHGVAGRS